MSYDICGLGNALMDVLVQLDSDAYLAPFDLDKGRMHLFDHDRWTRLHQSVKHLPAQTHPGGSCANVISTLAMLGEKVAFCGQVGDDELGRLYAASMEKLCGQHFMHLLPGGHSGKCLSLIHQDAERTMITDLGCAIELEPEHLFAEVIPQSRHLHVTGYLFTGGRMTDTAKRALEIAKAHGVRVSFDVADAWVVRGNKTLTWQIIDDYADVVFTNAEEATALCDLPPEQAVDALSERCKVAVVKLGGRGSLVRSEGKTYPIEIFKVKAVDTTGAGDSYAGGFLYGLLEGYPLDRCGRIASRVAAETVSQTGGVVSAPGKLLEVVKGL